MKTDELRALCLAHMRVGVHALFKGEIEEFSTKLVSTDDLAKYIVYIGGKDCHDLEINGWQMDHWLQVEYEGTRYTLYGEGYYGGVSISKADERDEE